MSDHDFVTDLYAAALGVSPILVAPEDDGIEQMRALLAPLRSALYSLANTEADGWKLTPGHVLFSHWGLTPAAVSWVLQLEDD